MKIQTQNILQKIFTISPALRPNASMLLFSCVAYGNILSSPQVLIPLLGTKCKFHIRSASIDEQDLNFPVAVDLGRLSQDLGHPAVPVGAIPSCSASRWKTGLERKIPWSESSLFADVTGNAPCYGVPHVRSSGWECTATGDGSNPCEAISPPAPG